MLPKREPVDAFAHILVVMSIRNMLKMQKKCCSPESVWVEKGALISGNTFSVLTNMVSPISMTVHSMA